MVYVLRGGRHGLDVVEVRVVQLQDLEDVLQRDQAGVHERARVVRRVVVDGLWPQGHLDQRGGRVLSTCLYGGLPLRWERDSEGLVRVFVFIELGEGVLEDRQEVPGMLVVGLISLLRPVVRARLVRVFSSCRMCDVVSMCVVCSVCVLIWLHLVFWLFLAV